MTARYKVTAVSFWSPHKLLPGSIIETDDEPSANFEPLNEEAEAAKEKWYEKEYETIDSEGKRFKHKPNALKRPANVSGGERASVTLIHEPPPENVRELVEAAQTIAQKMEPDLVATGGKETPDAVKSTDGKATIVHAAPAVKEAK